MSAINTGSIDINFPVPGINNSSQGFRSNFTGIKNNLDIAATELYDLQSKSIFKSALDGTTLNNDMDNGLIKNALVQGFRRSTYNLGNNLFGSVIVDVTRGDVQYGALSGNISLAFSKWPPSGTQANIELILIPPNNTTTILLPAQIDTSRVTIENYNPINNTITLPAGTTEFHLSITTEDCGTTLTIDSKNRPRKSTQVVNQTPVTSNLLMTGGISVNTDTTEVAGSGTSFLTELAPGRIILTSSNVVIGTINNITANNTAYLTSAPTFNISPAQAYRSAVPIGESGDRVGSVKADSDYLYVCIASYDGTTAIWRRVTLGTF